MKNLVGGFAHYLTRSFGRSSLKDDRLGKGQDDKAEKSQFSLRSFQSGLTDSIRAIFLLRSQPFIFFSLQIASIISLVSA